MTIRVHFRRLKLRFLGLFAEVRWLREVEARKNTIIDELRADLFKAKDDNRSLATANQHNLAQIEELRRGIAVTTEARLNADRHADILRGELQGIREISEREVAGMRQTVDAFSLQSLGRQVFGTAPLLVRTRDAEEGTQPTKITARQAQAAGTSEFYRQVDAMRAQQAQNPSDIVGAWPLRERFSTTDKAVTENVA